MDTLVSAERAREKIARLAAARAAVEAAKTACEAAGVAMSLHGVDNALLAIVERIDAAVASAERQRVPIAIGDSVEVSDGWRTSQRRCIESARTKWLVIGGARFDRATGQMDRGTGYGCSIHPDDLARINRDIPARKGGAR